MLLPRESTFVLKYSVMLTVVFANLPIFRQTNLVIGNIFVNIFVIVVIIAIREIGFISFSSQRLD